MNWTDGSAQFSARGSGIDPVTQVTTKGTDVQATITGIIFRTSPAGSPFAGGDHFAATVHTNGSQPWCEVRDLDATPAYDVIVRPALGQTPLIN